MSTLATAVMTCHVIISGGTNGNWQEKLAHEMAHCNGWVHPGQDGAYHKEFKPPRKYLGKFRGRVILEHVSMEEAMAKCKVLIGTEHMACYELK